jgi:tetratricopeptide (TPR) repeat protein
MRVAMKFFLQVRLLIALGLFFFSLSLEYLKMVRVLLFSLVLLATVLCTLGITMLSIPPEEKALPLSNTIITTSPQKPQVFTLNQYNQQLETFLFLSSTQPTHRDVLVNIALLYQAQNNIEKANVFWESAKELDPNNALFIE